MDWGAFIGPAIVAAVVSGIISMIDMVVSTRTALALHTEALKSDERLAQRKLTRSWLSGRRMQTSPWPRSR
jgi:hypothetical protein